LTTTEPDLRDSTTAKVTIPTVCRAVLNGTKFGKIARFSLATFGRVSVMNLTLADDGLKSSYDGFSDDTYGYVAPLSMKQRLGTLHVSVSTWTNHLRRVPSTRVGAHRAGDGDIGIGPVLNLTTTDAD
jgi:hypothetical protein